MIDSSRYRLDDSSHRILIELYKEYEMILWSRRVKMHKCMIEISESAAHWGQWHEANRTISLSRRLLEKYEWTTVVEILRHEMAHQYVTEAFPVKDCHGASFQLACDALGVEPWARTPSGELPGEIPSWRSAKLSPEAQRHIDKVNKLLSLAASTNEHEAALAMQRAQEISAKHRLERVQQRHASGCNYWFLPLKVKKIDATTKMIFGILRSFYFVRPISMSYLDVCDLQTYKGYDVAGNIEDLQMAEYVYEFLKRTVVSLWSQHKKENHAPGSAKRSYSLGVLQGFRDKLAEAQAKRVVDPGSRALVVQDEKAIEQFLKARYPRLSTGAGISGARDKESFTAGINDGRKIVLNKPITSSDGNKGRLLG